MYLTLVPVFGAPESSPPTTFAASPPLDPTAPSSLSQPNHAGLSTPTTHPVSASQPTHCALRLPRLLEWSHTPVRRSAVQVPSPMDAVPLLPSHASSSTRITQIAPVRCPPISPNATKDGESTDQWKFVVPKESDSLMAAPRMQLQCLPLLVLNQTRIRNVKDEHYFVP